MLRSTERFSSRIDNYVRYRPRYPKGVLGCLEATCGLTKTSSSSHSPEAGHPRHAPLLAELERIFVTHQVNGQVTVAYETNLYYGQLS
jgi:hypothetical protein